MSTEIIKIDSKHTIKYSYILQMALKNIKARKLRSFLTVLGVVIGIGSMSFLLSFGVGLQRLITRQIVDSRSVRTIDVAAVKSKAIIFSKQQVNSISGFEGVQYSARMFNYAGRVSAQSSQKDTIIYGVDDSFFDITNQQILTGPAVKKLGSSDIVVNQAFAKAIGYTDAKKLLGQKISGVVKDVPLQKGNQDVQFNGVVKTIYDSGTRAELYLSSSWFDKAGVQTASQLRILTKSRNDVATVRRQTETLGFSTTSPLDTLEQINQVFTFLNFTLVGFGGIGMIVAVLGMFNTLTITLLERTKEIGLLIAMGVRKKDIRRLVVSEAMLMSYLGAMAGMLGAFLLGVIANFILNRYASSKGIGEDLSVFYMSPYIVIGGVLLAGIVGWLVVTYPARRATRINPITALRHE